MSLDGQRLYGLLPALYRLRDAEHGERSKRSSKSSPSKWRCSPTIWSSFTTISLSRRVPPGWCPTSAM